MGVFFSGFIKDLLCLPRPLSPPLHRITMSGSAALEYGFPSTHSTNAVSVIYYAIWHLNSPNLTISPQTSVALQIGLCIYVTSIVVGRLYCGMHGFTDVVIGSVLGAVLGHLQCVYGEAFDQYLYTALTKEFLVIVMVILVFVRIHPEPADSCPCFDDSVAFAGVLLGVQFGHWHFCQTDFAVSEPSPATVPFHFQSMGLLKTGLRIAAGVVMIVVWREVMKPTLLRILPPLFRVFECLGLSLPRRFFTKASYVKHPLVACFISHSNTLCSQGIHQGAFPTQRRRRDSKRLRDPIDAHKHPSPATQSHLSRPPVRGRCLRNPGIPPEMEERQ